MPAKMMVPSDIHAPPANPSVRLPINCAAPTLSDAVQISNRLTKAIRSPSGEKKGIKAFSVPAIGTADGIAVFPRYFNLRASSIAGGTNEVQKNIVAKLVLGL